MYFRKCITSASEYPLLDYEIAINQLIQKREGLLELFDDNKILRMKLDKTIETIKFYADKSNWVSRTGRVGTSPIDTIDREDMGKEFQWAGGKCARQCLIKLGEGS